MAHDWTPEQRAAIDARSGTLLVSAAAGSGKTAVLTQRIIESILDPNDPVDITDLLVVTYTKAAATELKVRIGDAIRAKLAEMPSDKRLRRQQIGIERAEISTIHSFCSRLVGEGAARLGLPAGLRIADEAEIKLLQKQVIDRLFEEEYRKADPSFIALTDNFVTSYDDRFADKLLSLYNKVNSIPEGVAIFASFADQLEKTDRFTFLEGPFGEILLREVSFFAKHFEYEYRDIVKMLECEPAFEKSLPMFERDYEFLVRLTEPFDDFDALCNVVCAFVPDPKLPRVDKEDKTPEYEDAMNTRKAFRGALDELRNAYFGRLLETFTEDTGRSALLIRSIGDLLERFDKRMSEEKLRRGLLDFTDLERYTHRLLIENGQPTEYAKAVAGRYRQIYIDEYQDVNRIQDEIFKAVASDNRFMVGDIKQSIYAFRGADPSIFADYRKRFEDPNNEEGRLIFLSNNFRCDRPVVDFVNEVCRKLFLSRTAEVPYLPADELQHSKQKDSERGKKMPVQIALVSSAESDEAEAEYVAGEIERLIAEEGYRAEEIAILLRSPAQSAPSFIKALAKRSIAGQTNVESPFFEEPEVLLAISLLGTIDNPRQDVYLAGALMSPVFGFTLDEMLERFRVKDSECLYDKLIAAKGEEKADRVLDWLEHCRKQSSRLSSDEMIRLVYSTVHLTALVGADAERGKEAVTNLNKLYELARDYEQGGFMGLHRFLRFVSDCAEEGETVKSATGASSEGVQIVSIHHSKGLEFPICFLSDTMHGINLSDSREQILFDKTMGPAVSLRDESGFAHYNTLLRKTMSKKLIDSSLEEEMRALYVALTRARERLYITAKAKSPEKLLNDCERMRNNYSAYTIEKHPRYFQWIMSSLAQDSEKYQLILPDQAENTADCAETVPSSSDARADQVKMPDSQAAELSERIWRRMDFAYPDRLLGGLPAKLTVSELRPRYLDEVEAVMDEKPIRVEKPSFLQTPDSGEPTGAERGTATHIFMQFCDFDSVEEKGIDGELIRLTAQGFMDARMADIVYKEALEAFFTSELYREMRRSCLLKREFRFNVRLPAAQFTADSDYAGVLSDAYLLVQGVIDCFFELPDGTLKLIDYKTDRLGRSPAETSALLVERYGNQLRYYCMALEALTGKRVSEVALYSFWQSQPFSYPELLTVNSKDTIES